MFKIGKVIGILPVIKNKLLNYINFSVVIIDSFQFIRTKKTKSRKYKYCVFTL